MADPTNAPPSANPADQDNLGGVFNTVLRKFLQGVDDCLPARIISYDRDTNRAIVQPVVAMLTTLGAQVDRAQVASVPVFRYGAGGFVLSFPVKPGDLGWIKASDRDISLFLQSWAVGGPNTHRMHSFEDAWFLPDAMRNVVVAGEDADAVVLQSLDGTQKVSVRPGAVEMASGACSITMTPAGTNVVGPLTINGIVFNSHAHTGVQPGPGNSGGPV